MVQLLNLMRIMLLAKLTNTSRKKAGKQQLELIFQLETIRDQSLQKVLLKEELLRHYQSSRFCFKHTLIGTQYLVPCMF